MTAVYALWVNGLVEGMNKLLLGRLWSMSALHLGEDDCRDVDPKILSAEWADHFKTAIEHLNGHILPSF